MSELDTYLTDETTVEGKPVWDWCVYVLKCEWRAVPSDHKYADWKYAASKADTRLYVGSTDDLERRLSVHGENRGTSNWTPDHKKGSKFTYRYPPSRLESVTFCETKAEARELEPMIASELDERPGVFVWQN